MGNSASTGGPPGQHQGQTSPRGRTHSPSPAPGAPHRSLKTKKKSLELPDLASLALTSTSSNRPSQPKTPNIPIPGLPANKATPATAAKKKTENAKDTRGRAPSTTFSTSDLLAQQTLNNVQFPPRATPYYHAPPSQSHQQQQQVVQQQRRIQELYNQSNVPVVSYNQGHYHEQGFNPNTEVVRSSIPVALDPQAKALNAAGFLKPVSTKIVWRGGGWNVVLARAGDDEWRGRRVMERESPGSPIFETTVDLAPGTHHIRFLVDDQWRVADDLPTAVDDQGSLANYVAVPFPKARDPSFFPEDGPELEIPFNPISQEERDEKKKQGRKNKGDQPNPVQAEQWTSILPPELLEAFKEEEMYLAASQGTTNEQDAPQPNQPIHRISGFVPAPNIPPAPALPRHLDKLILNMRVSPGPAANGIGKNVAPVGNAASVIGSGQAGRGDRRTGSGSGSGGERRGGDTTPQRERRRGRERGLSDVTPNRRRPPPPAPPPSLFSDDGSVMGSSSNLHAILADGTGAPRVVESIGEEGEAQATTPVVAHATIDSSRGGTPSTPTTSGSTMGTLAGTIGNSSSGTTPATSTATSTATSPGPSSPGPSSQPSSHASSTTQVVSSRSITIDTSTMPSLTDDASVLPVPSHVVLHHLCTSAIKNGVLAVASTTRYRKKYLTTIYYKPT
ncbi:5'-AMP-activated protein kinase beta subunit, interation domain-containing protein [Coprinopsis sp. MPI-PUGE-AT-0042]|nr:5'-AMP-activated protein kinase beta subunit, interation domain-containing protein [Coprinopsis sp. MPI-PUGE-AT-0042]